MEEHIRLELFTVQQVRQWLMTGNGERGLSDEVISRTRAWSIIHNPYATDDLNIISAIFVNDEVAAYTHLFPDEQAGQRIYWNTTLYCAPKYEGRGYAAIVIGQFCELYGDRYFDLDAANASIANLKFCGLTLDFVPQYILSDKAIRGSSLKAILARIRERISKCFASHKSILLKEIKAAAYSIKYSPYVDDNVYAFICQHSTKDVFLRTQEIFDWIIRYPMKQNSPISDRVVRDSAFSSTTQYAHKLGVEVYVNSILIGFYILNVFAKSMDINYIYYIPKYKHEVFLSVAEHILYFHVSNVMMSDKQLTDFLQSYKLYSKCYKRMKSFSYPISFAYDASKSMQSGDGDNFI